jgi:hypothetical protein
MSLKAAPVEASASAAAAVSPAAPESMASSDSARRVRWEDNAPSPASDARQQAVTGVVSGGGIRVGDTIYKREDVCRVKIRGNMILVMLYKRDGTIGPFDSVSFSTCQEAEMAMRYVHQQM